MSQMQPPTSRMQPPTSRMRQEAGFRRPGQQSAGPEQFQQPAGPEQFQQPAGPEQFQQPAGPEQFQQPVGPGQFQQPMTARVFPTRNHLPAQVRTSSVGLLNQTLVDTTDLLTQVKAAHWNVKGPTFFALHRLFDGIAEDLVEHADEIAERATALGGEAKGTARVVASTSRIPELPTGIVTGQEYVQAVAERLAIHDANLFEGVRFATQQDDLDTADLLNEVSREVSKNLWFLEAHLQTGPTSGMAGSQQSF